MYDINTYLYNHVQLLHNEVQYQLSMRQRIAVLHNHFKPFSKISVLRRYRTETLTPYKSHRLFRHLRASKLEYDHRLHFGVLHVTIRKRYKF